MPTYQTIRQIPACSLMTETEGGKLIGYTMHLHEPNGKLTVVPLGSRSARSATSEMFRVLTKGLEQAQPRPKAATVVKTANLPFKGEVSLTGSSGMAPEPKRRGRPRKTVPVPAAKEDPEETEKQLRMTEPEPSGTDSTEEGLLD